MDTLGKRLSYLMEEHWKEKTGKKLSQEQLANELGLSQGAISKIYLDKVDGSTHSVKICKFFGCDPFWFDLGEGKPFPRNEDDIPIVPWNLIPNFSFLKEKSDIEYKTLSKESIDLRFKRVKRVFASKIPERIIPGFTSINFKPGQILLIDPDETPTTNKFVIVYNKEIPDPTFMKYFINIENKPYLFEATTNNERPIEYTNNLIICGVVIADFNIY